MGTIRRRSDRDTSWLFLPRCFSVPVIIRVCHQIARTNSLITRISSRSAGRTRDLVAPCQNTTAGREMTVTAGRGEKDGLPFFFRSGLHFSHDLYYTLNDETLSSFLFPPEQEIRSMSPLVNEHTVKALPPAIRRFAFALAAACLLPSFGHALTLQEGITIVTESGRDVAIARSDEEVARSAVSLARSPWLPWVDLYGRETWLRYEPQAKVPSGSFSLSQDQYTTYGFRATQLIYDFGRTSSSISAANYGLKAQEAGTLRTRNRAALDFINAYFDLLEAEELLKVAEEEVTQYQAHQKDASARLKAGVVTRIEVLQTEVTLADSRQRLLTAENHRALKASRVNSILMRSLTAEVHPSEITGHPLVPVSLEESWAAAEAQNPDLQDLDARIRAREENVSSLRGEYLPSIFVSGGYEYNENRYMVNQDNWSIIAGVNISLFAGGSTDAKVAMARSEVTALRMTRQKLLDAVRMEVQAAWLEVESSRKRIEVALSAVGQAQENLRLQRIRYQEGVAISTDVLDAVTMMTTAETNTWKANFGLKRAEASLLYAVGRDLASAYNGR